MGDGPKPNPTPLGRQLPFSRVDEHRCVDEKRHECEHYSVCLAKAAKANWKGLSCSKCPLAPADIRLGDEERPDLSPIPHLEEPPPLVANVGDLARVIRSWQALERARAERRRAKLGRAEGDERRELPHYIEAPEDSSCDDCGAPVGGEVPACCCDYCQAVVCERCRERHRCLEDD